MVNSTDVETVKSLPPAPMEEAITGDLPYNLQLQFSSEVTKEQNISSTLHQMLATELHGMGKVDLYELIIEYCTTSSKQKIRAGVGNSNATESMKHISMKPGGLSFTSNEHTYGAKDEVTLIVPNTFTRQIQPASSHLPSFKFYLNADQNIDIMVLFRLKVHGPIIKNILLEDWVFQ